MCPELKSLSRIGLAGSPIGEGAFGSVSAVEELNGKRFANRFVAKTFTSGRADLELAGLETISKLHQRLMMTKGQPLGIEKGVGSAGLLAGLPLLGFEGKNNAGTVRGYISWRLDTEGYIDFERILEDGKLRNEVANLPLKQKLDLALQLVDGFKTLKAVGFVHADVNPPNLFINIKRGRIALIDYDSGAVMSNPNDRPTTFGKPGDWLAPEIMDQLAAARNRTVHVDLFTDVWSVAVAIHYLVFLCHPLFFLKNLGGKTVSAYLSKFRWPEIDENDSLVNTQNLPAYRKYRRALATMPAQFIEKMSATIRSGYSQPALRTSYEAWELTLRSMVKTPPTIEWFKVDRNATFETFPVTLTWSVKDHFQLTLEAPDHTQTEVTAFTFKRLLPKEGIYKLHAQGYFGSETKEISIRVWQHPRLRVVTVPSPPIRVNNIIVPRFSAPKLTALALPSINVGAPIIRVDIGPNIFLQNNSSVFRFRDFLIGAAERFERRLLEFSSSVFKKYTFQLPAFNHTGKGSIL